MRAGIVAVVGAGCIADVAIGDIDPPPLAGGAQVLKVALNQGLQRVLYAEDGSAGGLVPLLEGREALLRVGTGLAEGAVDRQVLVVVEVTPPGGEPVLLVQQHTLGAQWLDADLETTANFVLDPSLLVDGVALEVSVTELNDGVAVSSLPTTEAVWTTDAAPLTLEPNDVINVVLVPVPVNGTLPDTSPATVELYRQGMLAYYPATDIVMTVSDPLPYNGSLGPTTGWESLLLAVQNERAAASVPANTYYYGIFKPAASQAEWCSAGCILGLSNLGSVSDDALRSSIGVVFGDEPSLEIMAHEIGHAHGRLHSWPCGGAAGADPSFPYQDGRIGSWGWDRRSNRMLPATSTYDVMGYCGPFWSSDFTYDAFWQRIDALAGLGTLRSARIDWDIVQIDAAGHGVVASRMPMGSRPGGEPVWLDGVDASGAEASWKGTFVPYSHLDGGIVIVAPLPDGVTDLHLRD